MSKGHCFNLASILFLWVPAEDGVGLEQLNPLGFVDIDDFLLKGMIDMIVGGP